MFCKGVAPVTPIAPISRVRDTGTRACRSTLATLSIVGVQKKDVMDPKGFVRPTSPHAAWEPRHIISRQPRTRSPNTSPFFNIIENIASLYQSPSSSSTMAHASVTADLSASKLFSFTNHVALVTGGASGLGEMVRPMCIPLPMRHSMTFLTFGTFRQRKLSSKMAPR